MLFNIKITNVENALEIILLDFKKKKKIKDRAQLLCHFVFYSSCYHPCNHFIVTTCHTNGNKGPTKPALCGKVSNWLITVQSFLYFFFLGNCCLTEKFNWICLTESIFLLLSKKHKEPKKYTPDLLHKTHPFFINILKL